jgi:integrase
MASVRKRTWKSGGKIRTGWVADYLDQNAKRHQQQFRTKGDADAFLVQARGEVAKGIHTPASASITVADACERWLRTCEQKELSRSTLTTYRTMVTHHIVPLIGSVKLAQLTRPKIEDYRDDLLKRSTRYTTDKAIVALKAVLDEALRRGLVAQNVARPVRGYGGNRRKVGIGIDVPSAEDVRTLIDHAGTTHGRSGPCSLRPLLVTAIFTGMRSGELRGLTWENVDFERRVIVVRQGADKWGTIRRPKTTAGEREIPMSSMVINTLREWKLICPRQGRLTGFNTPEHKVWGIAKLLKANPAISNYKVGKQLGVCRDSVALVRKAMPIASNSRLWLVFPSQRGDPLFLSSVWVMLGGLQRKIEMVRPDGKPKYSMHAFRHFFASWAIKQGYELKPLQAVLGHANAAMTLDIYGHLFADLEDAHAKFAASEEALLGRPRLQQESPVLQQEPPTEVKTLAK